MDENVYLHTLYTSIYYTKKLSLKLLEKIFSSGEVLSRRQQAIKQMSSSGKKVDYSDLYIESTNFCGPDYISLSDLTLRECTLPGKYNAYYNFGRENASIVFPKGKFEVESVECLDKEIAKYPNAYSLMSSLGESKIKRYSDLLDEVQAKDRISLEHMSGLLVPSFEVINFWLKDAKNIDRVKILVEDYKKLQYKYGYDVPIYDTISFFNLENDDGIKDTISMLRQIK